MFCLSQPIALPYLENYISMNQCGTKAHQTKADQAKAHWEKSTLIKVVLQGKKSSLHSSVASLRILTFYQLHRVTSGQTTEMERVSK